MSSICYLSVHQCEGVVFDDVAKLNSDLDALGGTSQLLDPEEFEYWDFPKSELNGFVKQDDTGQVLFTGRQDGQWEGYKTEYVSVYGCVYTAEFECIARHMTAGKLVLRYDEKGDSEKFYVLTPGKVEQPVPTF